MFLTFQMQNDTSSSFRYHAGQHRGRAAVIHSICEAVTFLMLEGKNSNTSCQQHDFEFCKTSFPV